MPIPFSIPSFSIVNHDLGFQCVNRDMEIFWDHNEQVNWEALADRARAPMSQRWIYGAVHAALGGQVHRAVIRKDGAVVALCQCLIRRIGGMAHLSLATNGPLWLGDCERARVLSLIRRTLPAPHPRICLFTLTDPVKSLRLVPMATPRAHAILPLPTTMQFLHGKWRNALRKAEQSNLHTRHISCPSAALAPLLRKDAKQQIAKSYRALPAAFTRQWHALSPDDLRLITVSKDHETLATALFLRHGNTATYHIAQTTPQGRKYSAARLILWCAFQDFSDRGVQQIDLGAIDTANAPGLARFKLGTGAKTVRAGPTVLAI